MLKQMIELLDDTISNNNQKVLIDAINMDLKPIPFVDSWVPLDEQVFFKTAKGIITLPLSSIFTYEDKNIDIFIMSPKRCYNKDEHRQHFVHYLNYFVNYFDIDKELMDEFNKCLKKNNHTKKSVIVKAIEDYIAKNK